MPCPSGVNIPMNFRLLNDLAWYGEIARNNILVYYNQMSKTEEEEEDSERKNNGAAILCVQCGECIPKCPQQIEIPDELEKCVDVWENKKNVSEVF